MLLTHGLTNEKHQPPNEGIISRVFDLSTPPMNPTIPNYCKMEMIPNFLNG